MKKLLTLATLCFAVFVCVGCGASSPQAKNTPATSSNAQETVATPTAEEDATTITITNNGHKMTFALNNSPASKTLLSQLPMTVEVKDFCDNEKLFYPKEKLSKEAPTALAKRGTLACFLPWGNLTIFYKEYGDDTDSDLVELGHITSGEEYIDGLSGELTLEKAAPSPKQ